MKAAIWVGFIFCLFLELLFPKEVKINLAHLSQGYNFLEAYLLTESFTSLLETFVWEFSASSKSPVLSVSQQMIWYPIICTFKNIV